MSILRERTYLPPVCACLPAGAPHRQALRLAQAGDPGAALSTTLRVDFGELRSTCSRPEPAEGSRAVSLPLDCTRGRELVERSNRKLAQHYHKSPDLVTDEELRQYFLYRTNVSGWSRVAWTIALCGIKFFYENTLKRDWTTVGLLKPKRVKSLPAPRASRQAGLPTVLSFEEVRRTLAAVHMLRHRVCLTTIYSCGLRLTEGRTLQIPNIDSDRVARDRFTRGFGVPLWTSARALRPHTRPLPARFAL